MPESHGLKGKAESFLNKFVDVYVSIAMQFILVKCNLSHGPAIEEAIISSKANFRSTSTFRLIGPALCDIQWTLGFWPSSTGWSSQARLHRRFQPSWRFRFDTDIELVLWSFNDASSLFSSTRTAVVNDADGPKS